MSAQTTPITERQLDLITRAHCDANGLIEPLLELKGGAKLKMIASLAQRGLIEQMDGQWRITGAAIAIIKGEAQPALVIEMLKRPEGATIAQISEATGWQHHTIRGTFAGALKKKLGLTIVSEKIEGSAGTPGAGQRLYRIAEEATA